MAAMNADNRKAELKMLDMEENLSGDKSEAYARKYDRTLLLLKKRVQEALAEGVPADESVQTQLLLGAVDVSRKIIRLAAMKK